MKSLAKHLLIIMLASGRICTLFIKLYNNLEIPFEAKVSEMTMALQWEREISLLT